MVSSLTFQQRSAIAKWLNFLTAPGGMKKWNKKILFETFQEYDLPPNAELSYSEYVFALRGLPFSVKRDVVCKILSIWSYASDSDYQTLYDTLLSILYLKMETGVECVLFNNILNVARYLNLSRFELNARTFSCGYTVDMYFRMPGVDFSDTQISFQTSGEDETPRVEYGISSNVLRKKMNFTAQPSQEDVSEMLQVLTVNNTKSHCPWIYLNYSLKCMYSGWFLHLTYNDIEYVDNNG